MNKEKEREEREKGRKGKKGKKGKKGRKEEKTKEFSKHQYTITLCISTTGKHNKHINHRISYTVDT